MIFFTDFDGVYLPGRAYFMAHQSEPIQCRFDPCVVGMINRLCKDLDGKIVIHSNWRNTEERRLRLGAMNLEQHLVREGVLPEYIHADSQCPRSSSKDRWTDICAWLNDHPEVGPQDFWIIEDTQHPPDWVHRERVITTDFDEGLTVAQYMRIRAASGLNTLLLPA